MQTLRRLPYWSVFALLIYMPFHVFLSQWLSLFTGGLDAWKLGKDIILVIVGLFTICLVWQKKQGTREFNIFVCLVAAYAVLHGIMWALHPAVYKDSALLGIIYNNRVLGYAVLGMGAGLLVSDVRENLTRLSKIVICVSTLVALFGVLQYFLPKDLMVHFGYGIDRGTLPAFFIDDKSDFPRVMSTLRDPNSLGAFLILPITWLTALLLRVQHRRRMLYAALLAIHVLALILTFSRGAWAAALLSVVLLTAWRYKQPLRMVARRYWPVLAVVCVLLAAGLFIARNTYVFKSYVTHSTGKPKAEYDSNGFHWVFAKRGLMGVVRNPFGHGPGTAGLASIQNPTGSFLTENYYIQIAYEVGVMGLSLFLAANVLLYRWLRRGGLTGMVLLTTFWAYVAMNMLFHMWSNEAVAAQWWLLAGMTSVTAMGTTGKRPS